MILEINYYFDLYYIYKSYSYNCLIYTCIHSYLNSQQSFFFKFTKYIIIITKKVKCMYLYSISLEALIYLWTVQGKKYNIIK